MLDLHVTRAQPSDTAVVAGLGAMQGGTVVPFYVGCHVYLSRGLVSRWRVRATMWLIAVVWDKGTTCGCWQWTRGACRWESSSSSRRTELCSAIYLLLIWAARSTSRVIRWRRRLAATPRGEHGERLVVERFFRTHHGPAQRLTHGKSSHSAVVAQSLAREGHDPVAWLEKTLAV